MSRFNNIESLSPQDDSDEFSCVDLYAVVEGRARPNPQRPVIGTGTGKNEGTSRDKKDQLQRMADHDAEQRKIIRAQALEQKSSRRIEQVQPATYPLTEKHKEKGKADTTKVTSCTDTIESSDKPRFKPSCSSSQSMIPHRSPATAPQRKVHDIPLRSASPAPRVRYNADSPAIASLDAQVPDTNHTRARRRSTMDNAFIGYQPDLHHNSATRGNRDINNEANSQVPTKHNQASRSGSIDNAPSRISIATSQHDTNNGATSSVGAQVPAPHTRARRRSTMDNSFIGLQIDLHHSSSPRSRRDINNEATTQVPTNHVHASRSSSIDSASIAFLPDLSRSSIPTSRKDTNKEANDSVGAHDLAKHTRARRRSTMDNAFIGYQPDLHHSSASRSSRDISNEAIAQVPTKHAEACRSNSIDNAPSRSSVATRRHETHNEATSSVGTQNPTQHTRARRRSTMDNAFIGYQPDLHHSSASRSSRDISNEAIAQVPTKHAEVCRSNSIDNAPSRSSVATRRHETNNEATSSVGTQNPTQHTRARRRSTMDNAFIGYQSDPHNSSAPRSSRDINNEATTQVPTKHTQACRGSTVDNASIARQPDRHRSGAQKSRRDINAEPIALADAQVPAERARVGRSSSIDNDSTAFLPELHRNAAQRSRGDVNKELTSSAGTQVPAKHALVRERWGSAMDNASTGIHPDPSGPSPLPRKKPSMHSIDGSGIQSVQPQSYCRSKGVKEDIAKPLMSPKIAAGKSCIMGRQTLCKTPVQKKA